MPRTNTPISSSGRGSRDEAPQPLHREPPPALPKRTERGAGALFQPASATCPHCQGVGFVLADVPLGHPDFGKAMPCHCKQEERLWRRVHEFQGMSNLASLARYTFA